MTRSSIADPWTTPERLALRESAAGFVTRHVEVLADLAGRLLGYSVAAR